jgi:hypothetical protein
MARHKTDYGIRETFSFYKEEGGTVEYSIFAKVLKEFYQELANLIIFKAFDFKMPFRLGRLRIRKYKPKLKSNEDGSLDMTRYRPDWAATKKLWAANEEAKKQKKLVYHLNDHSNGYQHRFFWEKRTSNIPNHSAYCFLPSRKNKRTLAAELKNEDSKVDYFE